MKIAVTIFLLILLVSIQTPLGQLFKFPLLIEHFAKHQQKDKVSLLAFLEDHYSPHHNDADLPEDEQLPFKSTIFYTIGYAVLPGIIKTNAIVPLRADIKVVLPDPYTPQQHLASIFHPPKL